jgi:hypothetical protein
VVSKYVEATFLGRNDDDAPTLFPVNLPRKDVPTLGALI